MQACTDLRKENKWYDMIWTYGYVCDVCLKSKEG